MQKHSLAALTILCVLTTAACSKSTGDASQAAASGSNTPSAAAKEAKGPALELFGVALRGADRAALRAAFKSGGMSPLREKDNYWTDTYSPNGVLEGASSFEAGYVGKSNKFAYAEYKFNSFMDSAQVGKIASLARQKYGEPTSSQGNERVGPVSYQWELPNDMIVKVSRGWPDTSTYLSYADLKTLEQMRQEQSAQQAEQEAGKARSQSSAF